MADIDQGTDHPEVSHRVKVVIEAEVDLYEYDDMDRGEATDEAVEAWKRLCRSDVEDALFGTVDRVAAVEFLPIEPPVE